MAIDDDRGTTAIQGYDPLPGAAALDSAMGRLPEGEHRIEMASETFESLLAQHLTDDAIERIKTLRTSVRAAV